jgi:AcrR family transcriptional regulator
MSERSLMHAATDTRPTLRRRIVEAADRVIREKGLSGATTREIARAAGCAEGSIYVHFADKTDLVIAVVTEREPHFAEMLELPGKAGEATVEDNLAAWLEELLELFRDNLPIFLALLGDRAVLARFTARVQERRTGPLAVAAAAAAYLRAEQELGRVRASADARIVAALLVGAGRDYGLASILAGAEPAPPQAFARETASSLVTGLAPTAADTVDPMPFEEDTP